METFLRIDLGIFFTVFVDNYLISKLIKSLWVNAGRGKERLKRYDLQTSILGKFEAIIYFIIFFTIFKNPTSYSNLIFIIGAWLTIKTMSDIWKKKTEKFGEKGKTLEDMYWPGERFNIFLIGTLANILASLSSTYATYQLIINNSVIASLFFFLPIFALVGTYIEVRITPSKEDKGR